MPLKRRSSILGTALLHRQASNGTLGAAAVITSSSSNTDSPEDSFSQSSGPAKEAPETTMISGADEANERRQRRGIQKRNSFGGPGHGPASVATPSVAAAAAATATPAPDTPVGGAVSGYSAAQLAAHYADCMKLNAENKISTKNAFHLKLIDYMSEMFIKKKNRANGQLDNFQAASCALDASAKIYAHRVDVVHSDTMKLASGVTSTRQEGQTGGNGADGGDDADEDGVRKGRVKRKKKSNTIEKNLANINCGKLELEFDIDPLFKKVSAQFDSGAGGGQFLSTLQIKDDTCEMLLDSTATLPAKGDTRVKTHGYVARSS